ncbi:cation diffusion facilitator family transporter [Salinarchaeum sp. Harcht-Bsk1]|nr:cation diffusion facilitator family transporter [Salinarchaeum sp. Harcht-Bsk1]
MLAVNVALVLAKAGAWYLSGSLAVGSEAINSLSDSAYSLVILAGLYLTTQPPDLEHPHGHERIEPFVSLFVAGAMILAGAGILYGATTAVIAGGADPPVGTSAIAVLVLAVVAKLWLYRYCRRVAERERSPAVAATAVDNRNDVLAAGAALFGVAGAQVGYPVLDPVAAGVVALFIAYSGVDIVRDNLNYLLGAAPPDHLREEIVERALSHPDVEGVHDVIAHYVGPEIDVSLHIEVEGDRTLAEAHDIESAVVQSIRDIDDVDDVFVHVDPKELGEWKAKIDDVETDPSN